MNSETGKHTLMRAGMVVVFMLTGGLAATARASVLNISGLSITGGSVTLAGNISGNSESSTLSLAGGPGAPIVTATYQGGTGNPAEPNTSESLTSSGQVLFGFNGSLYGGTIYNFTAASSCATTTSCTNTITGGPAPTGTVDTTANTITMNMSSWFMSWGGDNFNQGPTSGSVAGTYNSTNGAYDLTWTSAINGGPFDAGTGVGTWTLTGVATVAPVPLPAAFWLMGSGILGLVGVALRRTRHVA
ncbi:MAG: VPLPA-CTERM sorting domain-containing protein [Acidobacteriaceae bacterium]